MRQAALIRIVFGRHAAVKRRHAKQEKSMEIAKISSISVSDD